MRGLAFVMLLILFGTISYAQWTEPTAGPTQNSEPPLNSSRTNQVRAGALNVYRLGVEGLGFLAPSSNESGTWINNYGVWVGPVQATGANPPVVTSIIPPGGLNVTGRITSKWFCLGDEPLANQIPNTTPIPGCISRWADLSSIVTLNPISGTQNHLVKWLSANTIGDSVITEETSKISIPLYTTINSASGQSGLTFTKLNSSFNPTVSARKVLSIDDSGNVVLVEAACEREGVGAPVGGSNFTPGRLRANSLSFNGKIYIIGGVKGDLGELNDVWSSTNGASWIRVVSSAQWPVRHLNTSLVFNGKMWIFGGTNNAGNPLFNDVWSSTNGEVWVRETENASWSPRWGLTSLVFNNKMWIMGGRDGFGNLKNDVWSSSDGINWTEEIASGLKWSPRDGAQSFVFNNKIWIIGGVYDDYGRAVGDVWSSSDGKNWARETTGLSWLERTDHTAFEFKGKLWVIGGYYLDALRDVWSSSDGKVWNKEVTTTPWSRRYLHTAVVFDNKIFIMAGGYAGAALDDVWSSSDGINWTKVTP